MLHENEIKQIKTYCKIAGVKYFDVELELVDHMAEWILEKMNTQGISFETALKQMEFEFSKVELMQIVDEKRKLITQKLKGLYKQAFLNYFKLPQITLTFLLVAFVIYLGNKKNPELFPGFAMHIMNLIVLTYAWGRAKIVNENKNYLSVSLLSEKVLSSFPVYFIMPSLIYVVLHFCHMFEAPLPLAFYKASVYLFPLFVITCLAWRKVYIDMHHKIRELYPMAFSK